ncbi:uncharacterized protein LOC129961835 [Argiope bruennichi]|uniref:uncharacterized protein LOC129961835 n=1 Tax=Argiope bruennichi TaxID=94029 RepID=UPI002494D79C|nr:uncharacterized protein LOC129961835 [Argiope bruennichi]
MRRFREQNYKSKCHKLRTKWKILMEFEKMDAVDNVSCLLNVKRMDNQAGSVNVSYSMILLNDSFHSLGETIKSSTTGVQRGQEIHRDFKPLVATEDLCRLSNGKVNVIFCLGISGCHPRRKHQLATTASYGPSIVLFSKI